MNLESATCQASELVLEFQRFELRCLFEKRLAGRKILVLDQSLLRPLDRITKGMAFLQAMGVERVFKYENKGAVLEGQHVVYMMRPEKELVSAIAVGVLADTSTRQHTLACWPRSTFSAEKAVEEAGAWGKLALIDLPLHLIPLESDFLSLETPSIFKSLFLDGDQTALHTVALSLLHLERAWGFGASLPTYVLLGQHAASTYRLLRLLRNNCNRNKGEAVEEAASTSSQVCLTGVVMLSREVDMVTPMCSQVIYMGLIDDVCGVDAGLVELKPDASTTPPQFPGLKDTRRVMMSRTVDPILPVIGDSHVGRVHVQIKAEVRAIEISTSKKNTADLTNLKKFIGEDMPAITRRKQALALHIQLCEELMQRKNAVHVEDWLAAEHDLLTARRSSSTATQFVLECVHRVVPRRDALRLICLLSLCQDGLPADLFASLKKQFCDSYGLDHLQTWNNLQRVGLLTTRLSVPRFSLLRKRFDLVGNVGFQPAVEPTDIDYVTGGAYSPLSVRLVEIFELRGNSQLIADAQEALAQVHINVDVHRMVLSGRGASGRSASATTGALLVYFIGGCTYSEVAALRLLSRRYQRPIMIATTSLLNATGCVRSVEQKI